MHISRSFVILGLVTLLPGLAQAQTRTCPQARPDMEIVLDDEGTTAATGEKLGIYSCWMPKVAALAKNVCARGHGNARVFKFTVLNKCASVDARVELVLTRAPSTSEALDFKTCGFNGPVFTEDLPAVRGRKVEVCTAVDYTPGDGTRWATYAINVTHVRPIGGNQFEELNKVVSFDPEIIIEDNGKGFVGFGVIALLVAGLLYAIYRLLRRS